MENSPKKCFKLFSKLKGGEFYIRLHNEIWKNPEKNYSMLQAHNTSQERCIFLTDQDGSHVEGLWAKDWESSKNAFRETYPNAYERNKNILVARVWDKQ